MTAPEAVDAMGWGTQRHEDVVVIVEHVVQGAGVKVVIAGHPNPQRAHASGHCQGPAPADRSTQRFGGLV
jgi:hypothetical protein